MMKTHRFNSSKTIGDEGEMIVKELLDANGYEIEELCISDELRYGYDFKATCLLTDKTFGIEVKTDRMCGKTGNLFIEVEVSGKPGWFRKYKSDSRVIIAFVYDTKEKKDNVLFVPVKELLSLDIEDYPLKSVMNEVFYVTSGEYTLYEAKGYLVPLKVVENLAYEYNLFR